MGKGGIDTLLYKVLLQEWQTSLSLEAHDPHLFYHYGSTTLNTKL